MKYYLFISLFSICFLSSCNKSESNEIEHLFSVAPSDKEFTINSSVGILSSKITAKNLSVHNFSREFNLSTSSLDTFLIKTQMSYGAFEITNFGIDFYGAIISLENENIINSTEDFVHENTDFKIEVPSDGGYIGEVLFELDIEKSLTIDSDGKYVFDPYFNIKEL